LFCRPAQQGTESSIGTHQARPAEVVMTVQIGGYARQLLVVVNRLSHVP